MFARLIVVLTSMLVTCVSLAQPDEKPRRRPPPRPVVRHVLVAGDLCTARAGAEVIAELRKAAKDEPDAVVLELAGDAWRPDVVHSVGSAIRSSPAPVLVWLRDAKGRRVGAGQAMLGLVAPGCWIEPETRVEARKDDDRRTLAPKGTDHEKLLDELMRWAGERSAGRAMEPLLPRLLMRPAEQTWAVEAEPGALRLVLSEPSEKGALSLTRQSGATLEVILTPEAAVGLGLAAGRATYLADMQQIRGAAPGAPVVKAGSRLENILDRAVASLEALDRELDAIEVELKRKPRDQRINTGPFYRELGEAGLKQAASARERLAACEQLVADDPEIARTPPPGADRTADVDAHAGAWRKAFQKRRSQVERLEKKAKDLASR